MRCPGRGPCGPGYRRSGLQDDAEPIDHGIRGSIVFAQLVQAGQPGRGQAHPGHGLLMPGADGVSGSSSAWMVVPVLAGVAVLFILGIHPPGELTGLIDRAVLQPGAAR